MGKAKESTVTQQQAQATPEERELNQLEIQRQKELDPYLMETQKTGLALVNQLLRGEENLPGYFGDIAAGLSPEVTRSIAQESVKDIMPGFQSSGILDSGVAANLASKRTSDIWRSAQEYNLGQKMNLLNLALSGQAQVQAPIQQGSSDLSQRLAGLRSTSGQESLTRPRQQSYLWGAFNTG